MLCWDSIQAWRFLILAMLSCLPSDCVSIDLFPFSSSFSVIMSMCCGNEFRDVLSLNQSKKERMKEIKRVLFFGFDLAEKMI